MKLIFAGTPEFAAIALDALRTAGFDIELVLTRPDRHAGRGMRLWPSAVKQRALACGLRVLQPASLRDSEIQQHLRAVGADVMVVAAYGLILPAAVLAIPARGCLNIHASLLPRWRGAAPIQRALLAGDQETGITIMRMDAGLDTGAILLQEKTTIGVTDTAQTLHDRLALLGAICIVRSLRENSLPRAQNNAAATYADKVTKAEATIDWRQSAGDICRRIRAFNPTPGAATTYGGATLKIWHAQPVPLVAGIPGTIISANANGILVTAGEYAVSITELQRSGSKRLAAGAFLTGTALKSGEHLGD